MMKKDLLTESGRINMGIDFCGTNGLMAQHRLNGTEVSAPFQQGGGKGMSEGMGRDSFLNASLTRVLLYHNKDHRTGEMTAAAVQKHIILFAGFDGHMATNGKPQIQFLDGFRGNRHQPFLAPFAIDTDETLVEIEVTQRQVHQLRHAQATGEKHFDDSTVTMPLPFGEIDGGFQLVHFSRRKEFRQVFSLFGRLQQFGGILLYPPVETEKTIKRTDATEDTGL